MSDTTINQSLETEQAAMEAEQAAMEHELTEAPDYSIPPMPHDLEMRLDPYSHAEEWADGCGDLSPDLSKSAKTATTVKFSLIFENGIPCGFRVERRFSREAFWANVQPILQGERTVGFELATITERPTYGVVGVDGIPYQMAKYNNGKISVLAIGEDSGKPVKPGEKARMDALDFLRLGYAGIDQRKYQAETKGLTPVKGRRVPPASVNGTPKPETVRSHKPKRGPIN